MKKILALLLVSIMCFALVACDNNNTTPESNGDTISSDSTTNDNVESHTHSFGEWIIVKEATLTEEGLKEKVCECGEKATESIEKLKESEGLEFALNEDGSSYSVIGIGTCTDSALIIPSMYNGLPVTNISENAFKENTTIVSIMTGMSVTNIDRYAFYECTSLKTLILSDPLVSIQEYAFMNCFALADLIGGKGFKDFPLSAFYFCNFSNIEADKENPYYSSIDGSIYDKSETVLLRYASGKTATHFDIPDTVTTINAQSLYGASNLVSVAIPASVKSIGTQAFDACPNLTDVYYNGTQEDWAMITKQNYNSALQSATIHFSGETTEDNGDSTTSNTVNPIDPNSPEGRVISELDKVREYFTTHFENNDKWYYEENETNQWVEMTTDGKFQCMYMGQPARYWNFAWILESYKSDFGVDGTFSYRGDDVIYTLADESASVTWKDIDAFDLDEYQQSDEYKELVKQATISSMKQDLKSFYNMITVELIYSNNNFEISSGIFVSKDGNGNFVANTGTIADAFNSYDGMNFRGTFAMDGETLVYICNEDNTISVTWDEVVH